VALAFIDQKGVKPKFGTVDNSYSMKEYLDKAKEKSIAQPELIKLGNLIDKNR
jgi:hypothetical protein